MAERILKLRRADACSACGNPLDAGVEASWNSTTKTVTCLSCTGSVKTIERVELRPRDVAGASAAREYERRSTKELHRKQLAVEADAKWRESLRAERPVLGRVVTALTAKPTIGPESQATRAWSVGAAGEQRVGDILDGCDRVQALHDRRIPGSKANIDHLAVGPAGVYVIDAKKYEGDVEQRDKGTWLRTDLRLYVGGRDRTKLVHGVERQMAVVRDVLAAAERNAPVVGVLCFVDGLWPRFRRKPLAFGSVTAIWPSALAELVSAPGPFNAIDIKGLAVALDLALKRA